jgi:hypothetical protein
VPSGAVGSEYGEGERFCFHMSRDWWGRRVGHFMEDGEESDEEEEEEMEDVDDGAREMVEMLIDDARERSSLMEIAREALEVMEEGGEIVGEAEEVDEKWEEPDNEVYRALSTWSWPQKA